MDLNFRHLSSCDTIVQTIKFSTLTKSEFAKFSYSEHFEVCRKNPPGEHKSQHENVLDTTSDILRFNLSPLT